MLVCGSAPFQEANDSETLTMIMDCNYIVSSIRDETDDYFIMMMFQVPSHVSKPCQNLISSMLCRDPTKRATLDMVNIISFSFY